MASAYCTGRNQRDAMAGGVSGGKGMEKASPTDEKNDQRRDKLLALRDA